MLIEQELAKDLKENLNSYTFYFLENYDVDCTIGFKDNEMIIYDTNLDFKEKQDIIDLIKEDKIITEFFEFMPHNHRFEIHIQIPSKHKEDIYPLCSDDKPRIIVFAEYDEEYNICEPSFCVDDFKQEIKIKTYTQLYSMLENLECISSGYMGIEAFKDDEDCNKEINLMIAPSYLLLMKLLKSKNVKENLYEIMKRQELSILKDYYPQYKDDADYVLNVMFKKMYDIVKQETTIKKNYDKLPKEIKLWIDKMVSLKADVKNRDLNLWKTFKQCNISYETAINI